jgi:hypothetical protein
MSMCASSATNEPVLELPERVDLGERHVVLDEELRQPGDDRDELVEVAAGDARGGDDLLRLELAEGQDVREVRRPTLSGCSSATCSMSMPPTGRR